MSLQRSNKPIDAVVTWVDGSDPLHQQKLEAHLGLRAKRRPKVAAKTRYANVGEIDYCVASLFRFAPWLRRIFVVTDQQSPRFLESLDSETRARISLVDHTSIFHGHTDSLPTFNSLSIETMLWRIPGLADNFIYFNDDCFLVKGVEPEDFFDDDGVVLRGTLRPIVHQTPIKKLKRLAGAGRPTRRNLQSEAAEMAGLKEEFLDVGHVPHPMRVSTLRNYFDAHSEQLQENASYPLRNVRQFWTIALANHLELRERTVRISQTPEALYLGSSDLGDTDRLLAAENNPDCKFLCAQSLDNASDTFLNFWRDWMDRIVGRTPRAAS